MLEIDDLSLSALDRLYSSGCAKPRDVAELLLDRIGAGDPDWIFVARHDEVVSACAELEARRAAGAPLPLYGVPFGVKDNIDVAGMPTTAACPTFSYVPDRSARCVERLVQAGAICLGKTNLDQFATGLSGARSPYGVCSSVGNPLYVSGGSSSGSAVAVALGHVAFSLGTDTGGSGRIPAGFNGVVGIKPTVGRVSTRGLVPNCPTLDCVSIFALSVDDGMRVLRLIDGFDSADPFSRLPPPNEVTPPADSFRFGKLALRDREWFGMPECADLYEAACDKLVRIGGRPVEIDFAPFREAGCFLFDGPWIAERRAAIARLIGGHPIDLLDVTHSILQTAGRYNANDVFSALHRLAELRRAVEQQFAAISLLAVPTAPRPFTISEMLSDPVRLNNRLGHYSYFANLLDLCAIAIPSGVLDCGVPMGITLLAPAWVDEQLADVARAFTHYNAEQRMTAAAAQ